MSFAEFRNLLEAMEKIRRISNEQKESILKEGIRWSEEGCSFEAILTYETEKRGL